MFKRVLKNMLTKKQAIPFPEGFKVAYEEPKWEVNKIHEPHIKGRLDSIFCRSLRIRQVDAGSCNACEWECTSLTNPIYDIQRFGIDFVASPRHADALIVTGPVSRQMELALKKTYLATPEPRLVIACGDCAIDGGIYKGSYAVTNGVSKVIPVNCYIPGCPPTPIQIIEGIKRFLQSMTEGV